eukprot:Pompholyxophrys_punicea_v1_NODE_28_length_5163_cov_5.731206.p12 type:complete len:119 gc:universal NODE_28_length_5163_cov_5.731206:4219-4575(+)
MLLFTWRVSIAQSLNQKKKKNTTIPHSYLLLISVLKFCMTLFRRVLSALVISFFQTVSHFSLKYVIGILGKQSSFTAVATCPVTTIVFFRGNLYFENRWFLTYSMITSISFSPLFFSM